MIEPAFLQTGDTVLVIAPAGAAEAKDIQYGISVLQTWGLKVEEGRFLYAQQAKFAGTDEERLSDLLWALSHPTAKAVFCARGGYGCTRLLAHFDAISMPTLVAKWWIGYSDITALHAWLHVQQQCSIHALMPSAFANTESEAAIEALRQMLFGAHVALECVPKSYREGTVEGLVVGGNLSLLCNQLGTNTTLEVEGKILFLEEVGEAPYQIDRMLTQLSRAGYFRRAKGVVFGQFTESNCKGWFTGVQMSELICAQMQHVSTPYAYGFPIGHIPNNMPIACGMPYVLAVTATMAKLYRNNGA